MATQAPAHIGWDFPWPATPLVLSSDGTALRVSTTTGPLVTVTAAAEVDVLLRSLAGRRVWCTDPVVLERTLGITLPSTVLCATTLVHSLRPTGADLQPETGTATASTVNRLSETTSNCTKALALDTVVAEEVLWRRQARRGYLLDELLLQTRLHHAHRAREAGIERWGVDLTQHEAATLAWLEQRGIPGTISVKRGRPTVMLPRIADPGLHPDLPAYLALREQGAQLQTLKSWRRALRAGGRVYPRLEMNSAVTGRMKIKGPAMQGAPKGLRDIVLAEPGHVIIGVDHSGAEARVMASFINDAAFTLAVTTGDVYQELADRVGVERPVAKIAYLAFAYGQGKTSLAATVGYEIADAVHNAITDLWPALPAWMARVADDAERGAPLFTLTGRPLPVPGYPGKAANLLVQGSARDLFGQGVRRAAAAGLDCWLPIHDELLVLAPRGRQEETAVSLREAMTVSTPARLELTGEPEIFGGRWGRHPA